jgi:hypothetical protein
VGDRKKTVVLLHFLPDLRTSSNIFYDILQTTGKGKDTFFIPPEGGRAAEAFQSLFSHTDGKIQDGYGEVLRG